MSMSRLALIMPADVLVLATLRPDWAALLAGLGHPVAWMARVGADTAVAAVVGAIVWLLASWVALALLAAVAGALPGAAGRWSRALLARLTPALLRRLLIGSTGLGVVLAPVAAGAATPPAGSAIATGTAIAAAHAAPVAASPVPSPVWPVQSDGSHTRIASPRWPISTDARVADNPDGMGGTRSARPANGGSAAHSPTQSAAVPRTHGPTAPRDRRPPGDQVEVVAGDSLWLIAQRRLGAAATAQQTAAAWPRWYAANRDVIGDDPALIRPGQLLHAPRADAAGPIAPIEGGTP